MYLHNTRLRLLDRWQTVKAHRLVGNRTNIHCTGHDRCPACAAAVPREDRHYWPVCWREGQEWLILSTFIHAQLISACLTVPDPTAVDVTLTIHRGTLRAVWHDEPSRWPEPQRMPQMPRWSAKDVAMAVALISHGKEVRGQT